MSAGAGVQTTKKMIKNIIYLTSIVGIGYLAYRRLKPFFTNEDPRLKDWVEKNKRRRK